MNQERSFRFARKQTGAGPSVWWYAMSVIAGLLIPLLVVVLGVLFVCLDNVNGIQSAPVYLGQGFAIPLPSGFVVLSPKFQLVILILTALLIAALLNTMLWRIRRGAENCSLRLCDSFHQQILEHSLVMAESQGAAVQGARAAVLLGQKLPIIQKGLVRWWRAIPMSVVHLVGCFLIAAAIKFWLAILAVSTGLLLWYFYRWLQQRSQDEAYDWETPLGRDRMVDLIGQAPLFQRLQSGPIAASLFSNQLTQLSNRHREKSRRMASVQPLIGLAVSVGIALMLLSIGGQFFWTEASMSLPSALTMMLALSVGVIAGYRLLSLRQLHAPASDASASLFRFLEDTPSFETPEYRVGMNPLQSSVQLSSVSLTSEAIVGSDGGGMLLEDVSLQLQPGSIVAVVGTEHRSNQAFVELLLGLGYPQSGSITIDDQRIHEIHPKALSKQVLWVGRDGPLWNASLQENLLGGLYDAKSNPSPEQIDALIAALKVVGLEDLPGSLGAEGIAYPLSINDSKLGPDIRYALGVARALLRRPSIIVVDEPPLQSGSLDADRCFAALKRLASEDNSLVVFLPNRINTLRHVDEIVLLQGSRMTGHGTHQELLAGSDLYRHLNYQLFNPYRDE